ncbi:MAG: hypothetical protein HFJ48_02435 [Clostridia bacterium]|nr:hypothetical protein [Clostridia bacterium]
MATARKSTSKIHLPPENSEKYVFGNDLGLVIKYNAPISREEYESRFGGNER